MMIPFLGGEKVMKQTIFHLHETGTTDKRIIINSSSIEFYVPSGLRSCSNESSFFTKCRKDFILNIGKSPFLLWLTKVYWKGYFK